jgi:regulator of replication initiation timing
MELAMREMTVQMATMTSELTAIRENVSRILAEVADLGTEMSRVVEGNAALQNKLFDLSDGLSQMRAEDTKKYTDLRNNMSGFLVAMNAMAANPSATQMLEMLSAQVRETQNAMNTLLQGTHSIPTLALLLPKTNAKLWQKADPRNLFMDKYILVFLCGQTYQRSPKDYPVNMIKQWVVKAMPVLKLGLMLLKAALAAGGIPIPGLSDILGTDFTQHVKYVNLAMKHLDKRIDSAVDNKIKDGIVETLGDGLDAADDREDLEEIVNRIHSNPEGSRQAYDAIKQLLKDEDIPSTCGLRQVICNGKVGWVLDRDDVEEAFRERCLR